MYVGFVDLVKAYDDTANHALLIDILRKYGVLPKLTTAIETIYRNNACVLKIENEIREIPQTVGVRQGDNMAPVLFLFLMTAFVKTLEFVWKERDIPILRVMTIANEHIAEGKIFSHTPAMFKSKKITAYEILQCLYVDDGAFPFETREDLQHGMELIFHHFTRFGLEMHVGRGASESKTECVFFPPPQFFQRNPTSVQEGTTSTRRGMHCGATTILALSLSPSTVSFPIKCRVIVASSHPQHANTFGAVIVKFAPKNCSRESISMS